MIAGLTLPVTLAAPVAGSPVASPASGGSGFARALSAAEPAQSTPVAEAAADPAAETALPDTNLAAAMAANRAPAAPRSPQGAKSILQLHGHGATRPMATEATATEADDPVSAPARAPDEGLPAEPRVSEAPPSLQSLLAGLQLPPATNESGRADGLPGPAPLSREGPSTRPERAGKRAGRTHRTIRADALTDTQWLQRRSRSGWPETDHRRRPASTACAGRNEAGSADHSVARAGTARARCWRGAAPFGQHPNDPSTHPRHGHPSRRGPGAEPPSARPR